MTTLPPLRLSQMLIALWPERREAIEHAAADFYTQRISGLFGQYLVSLSVVTVTELHLALVKQRTERGENDSSDDEIVTNIRREAHRRTVEGIQNMARRLTGEINLRGK